MAEMRRTGSREVTVDAPHQFAQFSGDDTAIHLDSEAAAASVFGKLTLQGTATFALASGLMVESGVFEGGVFVGASFKLLAPAVVGDVITVEVGQVSERITSSGERAVVGYQFAVINQDDVIIMEGVWTNLKGLRTRLIP